MTANRTTEEHQSLWLLTVGPLAWSGHFLASYVTAAVWCAKFAGMERGLGAVRGAIAVYTAAAVAVILWSGWSGWRRHRLGGAGLPHDQDLPEDRHRFLGFATFLLAALSGVATLMVAMVVLFFHDCR